MTQAEQIIAGLGGLGNIVEIEACITRHGTIVGPFMTDLTGYAELTPYKGGWCGNDLFPEALTDAQRETAIRHVQRLGDRLAQEGYKGFLEIDVLVDTDTDDVYLGELNPRISGASSMTNVTAGAYADVPLFLFHLLEFMDVDYVIDIEYELPPGIIGQIADRLFVERAVERDLRHSIENFTALVEAEVPQLVTA